MIHCSQFCINVTLIPERRKSFALNEIKAEHILLEKINVDMFTLFWLRFLFPQLMLKANKMTYMDYQTGNMQEKYFRFKPNGYDNWNNAPQNVHQQ